MPLYVFTGPYLYFVLLLFFGGLYLSAFSLIYSTQTDGSYQQRALPAVIHWAERMTVFICRYLLFIVCVPARVSVGVCVCVSARRNLIEPYAWTPLREISEILLQTPPSLGPIPPMPFSLFCACRYLWVRADGWEGLGPLGLQELFCFFFLVCRVLMSYLCLVWLVSVVCMCCYLSLCLYASLLIAVCLGLSMFYFHLF